jgi:hypothetical protein
MIDNFLPLLVFCYALIHAQKTGFKNLLPVMLFLSFFAFASNYTAFFDFDFYRYLHRIIGVVSVIALIIFIFKNKINFFKDSVPQIFLLFFLGLLISFIGNELYMPHYLHYLRNFIFIASITVYLYYQIDSNEKLDDLFKFIFVTTIILSIAIVIESIFLNLGEEVLRIRKVNLYFGNNNYLAYSLLPGFSIGLFSKKKYYIFLSVFIFLAILMTGSRSIILASLIPGMIHIFYQKYRIKNLILVLGAVLIFLFYFSERLFENTHTSSARVVLAKITLNIIHENPFNGIGYGQFRTSFDKYIDQDIIDLESNEINDAYFSKNPDGDLTSKIWESKSLSEKEYLIQLNNIEKMTHNDLLTVVSELGLLGLAITSFIFFKLFQEQRRLLIYDKRNYYLSLSLILSSLFFSMFHNNMTVFVFWFLLFLPFVMNRNYKKQNKL